MHKALNSYCTFLTAKFIELYIFIQRFKLWRFKDMFQLKSNIFGDSFDLQCVLVIWQVVVDWISENWDGCLFNWNFTGHVQESTALFLGSLRLVKSNKHSCRNFESESCKHAWKNEWSVLSVKKSSVLWMLLFNLSVRHIFDLPILNFK